MPLRMIKQGKPVIAPQIRAFTCRGRKGRIAISILNGTPQIAAWIM